VVILARANYSRFSGKRKRTITNREHVSQLSNRLGSWLAKCLEQKTRELTGRKRKQEHKHGAK